MSNEEALNIIKGNIEVKPGSWSELLIAITVAAKALERVIEMETKQTDNKKVCGKCVLFGTESCAYNEWYAEEDGVCEDYLEDSEEGKNG